ncbi:MAG: CRTAC1 family protein [Pseudomonadota bacterium]
MIRRVRLATKTDNQGAGVCGSPGGGWTLQASVVLLSLSTVAGCGGSSSSQAPAVITFTDITDQAGIALTGLLVESLAFGDFDDDGDADLYLTGNGGNRLFRNDGNGEFTDITDAAGVGDSAFGVGAAFADLDNDGDLDLYVVNFQGGPDLLYRNEGPDSGYSFTNVAAAAGITNEASSRGMAFIDFDRDGLLDIYVNAIGNDILYRNEGDLLFTDVAAAAGVQGVSGQGVGVVATDVNNDGWVDLFTGNRSGDPNRLFLNQGGTFADITAAAGITETGLGMGVISFDYDNDGDFDLYWTTWPDNAGPRNNAFYENIGGDAIPVFAEIAESTGTADAAGWGISANTGDIDNDGWMDFFVTNGFDDSTSPNVLFRNLGDTTFEDITDTIGGGAFDGRGVAFADIDNDGDLDLAVTADVGEPTRLWRNDSDNRNHWLTVDLRAASANRSAVGARIELTRSGGSRLFQEVSGGAGRGSFNDLRVEFGLGENDDNVDVLIRFPNGHEQKVSNLRVDQFVTIFELFADFDTDGDVDNDDFAVWQSNFGASGVSHQEGDADADGDVDNGDLAIWQAEFGTSLIEG